MGRCAIQPDLLFVQLGCIRRVGVEGHAKELRNIGVLNGQLPGQEYLAAVLLRREIGQMKAVTVARNDGVGLAGIENHHRAPDQRDALAGGGEMHVQPPVIAHKEIAKRRTAIVGRVVVVLRAAAGHQGHVAGCKHVAQTQRAGPLGHRLHAVRVVGPAHARTRQRQDLDITRLQAQALRDVPLPVRNQPGRRRGDVDRTGQHHATDAAAANGVTTPEVGREAVWRTLRWRGLAHTGQCILPEWFVEELASSPRGMFVSSYQKYSI